MKSLTLREANPPCAAASSVDLTAGAYAVAVVKLAAGCALSALFASLSGALFDAAED